MTPEDLGKGRRSRGGRQSRRRSKREVRRGEEGGAQPGARRGAPDTRAHPGEPRLGAHGTMLTGARRQKEPSVRRWTNERNAVCSRGGTLPGRKEGEARTGHEAHGHRTRRAEGSARQTARAGRAAPGRGATLGKRAGAEGRGGRGRPGWRAASSRWMALWD